MSSMSEAVKCMGYFLAWLCLACNIYAVACPDWRINDVEGEVVESIKRTQGLWVKCAFFPTGNWQCEDYDRFFIALPSAIIGARVFACFSVVFQLAVCVSLPFGMHCTHVFDEAIRARTKAKISLCCGLMGLLSGICIGIAVSWYAALVVEDYSRFTTGLNAGIETAVQRFVYGKALYFGWIGMSLSIIQGVILCCSSWGGTEKDYIHAPQMEPTYGFHHQQNMGYPSYVAETKVGNEYV